MNARRHTDNAKGKFQFLAVFLCMVYLFGVASAEENLNTSNISISNKRILIHFGIVAFNSEAIDLSEKVIRKWDEPIRIYIDGYRWREFQNIVEDNVQKLNEIIDVDLQVVNNDSENINFRLFFLKNKEEMKILLNSELFGNTMHNADLIPCAFVSFAGESYRIYGAIVIILANNNLKKIEACVVEEITQSLGLFNDHPDVYPSIFNDDQEYRDLTWHDILLLQILYDHKISPGMKKAQALKIASEILGEIRPESR